jgi:hypothetical protein
VSDYCDSCDCCPWEEPLDAHDRRVDRLACEVVGHRVRRYETGGRSCLRCWATLSESREQQERHADFERRTAGMSPLRKMMAAQMIAIDRRYMMHGTALITDLTEPVLAGL